MNLGCIAFRWVLGPKNTSSSVNSNSGNKAGQFGEAFFISP
jgi:hypothetical protein